MTRLFSVAVVDVHVLRAGDLDVAMATMTRVAGEVREDVAWAERFPADAPATVWVTGIGMDGASVRLQQQAQGDVASELRRRLVAALASESIGTGRWDTPMPIDSRPFVAPAS